MLKAAAPTRSHTAVRAGGGVRTHAKGEQTRAEIVAVALAMAARVGLEGLSIGTLADAVGKSKSGVFAHFGSREDLQIAVVREYYRRFETEVFAPAMRKPRGLPRVRALFENWMRHTSAELQSGCIFISGAVEFDDRPGPVRDALVSMVRAWQDALERAIRIAIEDGQLKPDTDAQQMLFEMHGLILALHHDARLMRTPGSLQRARQAYERVVNFYLVDGVPAR